MIVGLIKDDQPEPQAAAPGLDRPGTIKSAGDAEASIQIALPKGWEQTEVAVPKGPQEYNFEKALRITSPGAIADVTILPAAGPGQRRHVFNNELAALEVSYGKLKTLQPISADLQLGDYPAISTAVEAVPDKAAVRFLVSVVSTRARTYLIEVRYPAGGDPTALTEAQAALATISLE